MSWESLVQAVPALQGVSLAEFQALTLQEREEVLQSVPVLKRGAFRTLAGSAPAATAVATPTAEESAVETNPGIKCTKCKTGDLSLTSKSMWSLYSVACDVCEQSLTGDRYSCVSDQCDFDVCIGCAKAGAVVDNVAEAASKVPHGCCAIAFGAKVSYLRITEGSQSADIITSIRGMFGFTPSQPFSLTDEEGIHITISPKLPTGKVYKVTA